jgi:hypothetical protein
MNECVYCGMRDERGETESEAAASGVCGVCGMLGYGSVAEAGAGRQERAQR